MITKAQRVLFWNKCLFAELGVAQYTHSDACLILGNFQKHTHVSKKNVQGTLLRKAAFDFGCLALHPIHFQWENVVRRVIVY